MMWSNLIYFFSLAVLEYHQTGLDQFEYCKLDSVKYSEQSGYKECQLFNLDDSDDNLTS